MRQASARRSQERRDRGSPPDESSACWRKRANSSALIDRKGSDAFAAWGSWLVSGAGIWITVFVFLTSGMMCKCRSQHERNPRWLSRSARPPAAVSLRNSDSCGLPSARKGGRRCPETGQIASHLSQLLRGTPSASRWCWNWRAQPLHRLPTRSKPIVSRPERGRTAFETPGARNGSRNVLRLTQFALDVIPWPGPRKACEPTSASSVQ